MKETSKKILVIGQVVSTHLYGLGRGVIYGIEGEQSPGTVNNRFGGVIYSGGNATFDIAFESGSFSKKLPECILRGVQWTIIDEVMNAADVAKVYRSALAAELERLDDEAAQEVAGNASN